METTILNLLLPRLIKQLDAVEEYLPFTLIGIVLVVMVACRLAPSIQAKKRQSAFFLNISRQVEI